MRSLGIWMRRGLRAGAGLHLGLALLVALVVVIVPGSVRAGRILKATVDGWAGRLSLADVEVLHGAAPAGAAPKARSLPGVRDAEERLRGSGRLDLGPGRSLPATIEVLPEDQPPRLDRISVVEGRYPAHGEVAALVDRSVAAFHGVRPGHTVTVRVQGMTLALPVVGIVLAAEYLFTPVHPEHALPVQGSLAPVWLTAAALDSVPWLRTRRTSLLLALEPGADPRAVARAATAFLDAPVSAVVPREEGAAQRFSDMVLAVFDAYIPTVDVVLTVLAAVLLALVVGRRVRSLRAEVALWLALGQRPFAIALALVAPGVLATLAGVAVGAVGHRFFAFAVHRAIEGSMGIAPAIDPGFGPEVARIGAILVGSATLAGGLAALGLLRRRPARLLREGARPGGRLARRVAGAARRLPTPALLGISQALSRPWTALGLLLALAGMFASLLSFHAVHRSYELGCIEAVQRSGLDAVVRFDAPRELDALDDLARRAEGRAEPLLTGVGLLTRDAQSRFVQVVGLKADGFGAGLRRFEGRLLANGAEREALVDRWVAERMGAHPGTRLELKASQSAPSGLSIEVVGVVETIGVGRVYVSVEAAQALYGLAGKINGAEVASPLPSDRLEASLAAAPGVERALSLAGAREDVLATLEGGREVLRLALLFDVLLTATFLAVVGAMDARDRLADVAVLHALGWGDRALAATVGVEMAVRTGLSLALGIVGSIPLTNLLLTRLGEADRHTIDAHASPTTPWVLAAFCLVMVPVAAAPAWRTLLRLSPARALRLLSRE